MEQTDVIYLFIYLTEYTDFQQASYFSIIHINMTITALLLLLQLLAAVSSQTCLPADPAKDLFDSGKVSLVRTNPNLSREHCFTINAKYQFTSLNPQIVVSTSSINGYNPQGGFDYSVQGGRKGSSNSALVSLYISEDFRWTSIDISYLISSKDDLILGSFVGIPIASSNCNIQIPNIKNSVETYAPKWRLKDAQSYRVAAFISGIRSQASYFTTTVTNSVIDNADGRIVVQYSTVGNPSLEFIQISYIVFLDKNSDFSFLYSGNPTGKGTYGLIGVSSLKQNTIDFDEFVICRSGTSCAPTEILSGNECICRPGLIKVNSGCRNICAPNAYFNDLSQCVCVPGFSRNSQGVCSDSTSSPCPPNEHPVTAFGNCACNTGFYRSNRGICISICGVENQIWDGGNCVCKQGYFKIQTGACIKNPDCKTNQFFGPNGCICIEGHSRNANQVCVKDIVCPANQENRNGVCECVNGFYRHQSGTCIRIPTCNSNEILVNNRCQCRNGFTQVSGSCVQIPNCRDNEQLVNNVCQCKGGFIRAGLFCISLPSCGANEEFVVNKCECKSGFVRAGLFCIAVPNCGANEQLINNKCECRNGFIRIGANCIPIPQCGQNEQLVQNNCECQNGFVRMPNGSCMQKANCGANQVYISATNTCQCYNNYVPSPSGGCQLPSCNLNEVYNTNKKECECLPGYQRLGFQCVNTCGVNSEFVGGKCTCKDGHFSYYNVCHPCPAGTLAVPDRSRCKCNQKTQIFDIDNKSCVSCKINEEPNADYNACLCKPGFEKVGNSCAKKNCPQFSNLSPSGECVCAPGYSKVGQNCQPSFFQCPTGSQFSTTAFSCVCTDPLQKLINGACQSCKENQEWQNNVCVCKSGFSKVNGACRIQNCPQKSNPNGSDCVCIRGYYFTGTSCNLCHSSCGECKGPGANECTGCINTGYVLKDGYCTKDGPCPPGSFLSGSSCQPCQTFCTDCSSPYSCDRCAQGFAIEEINFGVEIYKICASKCGDGFRVDMEQCDDGNLDNNDGCSSTCLVEDKWSCYNGTSSSPSICTNSEDPIKITIRGGVNNVGKALMSIRLSRIPSCFLNEECLNCHQILDVQVIKSQVPLNKKVSYIPNNNGQFTAEFDSFGSDSNYEFTISVRINKNLPDKYKGCFTEKEYDMVVVQTIYTALLVRAETVDALNSQNM